MAASPQILSFPGRVQLTEPTGIPEFDRLTGGLPTGAITEIFGSPSSGRTSLLLSLFAAMSMQGKVCALVDSTDSFDPASAERAGVRLANLVWVRCNRHAGHAFKAADMLLHGGGFGLIALDLADLPRRVLQHIPLSYWYRFRRAIEHTPASLVVLSTEPQVKSCATLLLETKRSRLDLSGAPGFHLLRGLEMQLLPRKPVRSATAQLRAEAIR
jgi:RecA/RadA recombinase